MKTFLVGLGLVLPFLQQATACVDPTWGDGTNGLNETTVDATLAVIDTMPMPFVWGPFVDTLIGRIVQHETPIQFRSALYQGTSCYNVAAAFHDRALDIFGNETKSNERRRCAQPDRRQERVTMAYAFAYSTVTLYPELKATIAGIMSAALKFNYALLDDATDGDITTPWGLAKTVIDEFYDFTKTSSPNDGDGWNADGSLSKVVNRAPFADFNYKEYNMFTPGVLDMQAQRFFWQPLLESNGQGYFTKQEHVTPFIGATARLHGISNEELVGFRVGPPESYGYSGDYVQEARAVLNRTRVMASSDSQKVLGEVFDSKFTSLLPLQIQWSAKKGMNEFDFWFYDMALVTAMYDAVVLVWREKINYNRVRPTTVVHAVLHDQLVTTFAGGFKPAQSIPASSWEPQVRTMPHGEFPSGSSCVCAAYAELMIELTGNDTTGVGPLIQEVKQGSSIIEPGLTPQQDLVFEFNSWSEISDACGESRLYGGMHFAGAVPAGADLCTGNISPLVAAKARKLKDGDASGRMVDYSDRAIKVREFTFEAYPETKAKAPTTAPTMECGHNAAARPVPMGMFAMVWAFVALLPLYL